MTMRMWGDRVGQVTVGDGGRGSAKVGEAPLGEGVLGRAGQCCARMGGERWRDRVEQVTVGDGRRGSAKVREAPWMCVRVREVRLGEGVLVRAGQCREGMRREEWGIVWSR
jgi:hypothetical protein